MTQEITLYMDQRIPVRVKADEFEIIKLMIKDEKAENDPRALRRVMDDLVEQGYTLPRARELCVLASDALKRP